MPAPITTQRREDIKGIISPGAIEAVGLLRFPAFPPSRRPHLCLQILGSEHPNLQTNRCVPGGGAAGFMIMHSFRCYVGELFTIMDP